MDSPVKRRFHPLVLFLAISLMLSCVLPVTAPVDIPTTAPGGIDTIVAQTAAAAATQTAMLFTPTFTPSVTPSPTRAPSDTPTTTSTFIFILLTPTNIPGLVMTPSTPITPSSIDYECKLTGQSPANYSALAANQDFETIWTVANTGRKSWDSTNVDFIYLSGARLSKSKAAADLPKTVPAGQAISLKLPMTSPKNTGTYKTVWSLRFGQNEFCPMSVSIVVK